MTIAFQAGAQPLTPVPEKIQVPSGHVAYLKGSASGTQNFVCLPAGDGLAWKFQGPQATVFLTFRWMNGEVRQQIMTHYLSPNPMEDGLARATWQSSLDTSSVWAKKIEESSDRAFVAPGAIPWFLLQIVRKRHGTMGGATPRATS